MQSERLSLRDAPGLLVCSAAILLRAARAQAAIRAGVVNYTVVFQEFSLEEEAAIRIQVTGYPPTVVCCRGSALTAARIQRLVRRACLRHPWKMRLARQDQDVFHQVRERGRE